MSSPLKTALVIGFLMFLLQFVVGAMARISSLSN